MKLVPIATAAIAFLAAAVLAYDGLIAVAVAVAIPALIMGYASFRGWLRMQLAAHVILVSELVLLGAIWPSYHTIAAILVLPTLPIAVWCAVKRTLPNLSGWYIRASALVAAVCLLWQALFLAQL